MNRSGLNLRGSSYSLSDNEIAQAFHVNTVPAGNLYPSYSSSLINVVGAPKGAIFGRHLRDTSELVLPGGGGCWGGWLPERFFDDGGDVWEFILVAPLG
jgi:hypothetical protein